MCLFCNICIAGFCVWSHHRLSLILGSIVIIIIKVINQYQSKVLHIGLLTAWDEAGDGGAARMGGELGGCGGASRLTVSAYDVVAAAEGLGVPGGPFSADSVTSDDRAGNKSSPSPGTSLLVAFLVGAGCSRLHHPSYFLHDPAIPFLAVETYTMNDSVTR